MPSCAAVSPGASTACGPTRRTRPRPAREKEALGRFVSGPPFDDYGAEPRRLVPRRMSELRPDASNQTVAGLVVAVRVTRNRRGESMAFVLLDDRSGRIEVTLFADVFEASRERLVKDSIVVVEGQASHDDYSGSLKMLCRGVASLEEARAQHARALCLTLTEAYFASGFEREFSGLLGERRGQGVPLEADYRGR